MLNLDLLQCSLGLLDLVAQFGGARPEQRESRLVPAPLLLQRASLRQQRAELSSLLLDRDVRLPGFCRTRTIRSEWKNKPIVQPTKLLDQEALSSTVFVTFLCQNGASNIGVCVGHGHFPSKSWGVSD